MGIGGALYRDIKQLERESGHSPPSSAQARNEWSYTFTLPVAFMVWTEPASLFYEGGRWREIVAIAVARRMCIWNINGN